MAAPEKILFVIDQFRNPYAGTEGQLFQLVNHLDRKRFTPHLLVFSDSDYLQQEGFPCDYTVLGTQRLASPVTWWRLWAIARTFRKAEFRLAHVFFNDASLICPPIFWLFGIKAIISRRDMGYWYTPGLLRVLRLTGRFVTVVLANSQAVAEITHKSEAIPRERISVIYNGVIDRSPDMPGEIPELDALERSNAIIAMLVANIRPIKRIGDAIAALARLAEEQPRLHLAVIGGGDAQDLEVLASEMGVSDRVHFLGARNDVPVCLTYADIGLLCSESEGFSNSIVEYMQQGVPVICTETGGNPEAVTHEETGFLYPVGDVESLSYALKAMSIDETKRVGMGREAQVQSMARFAIQKMVENHAEYYLRVLNW